MKLDAHASVPSLRSPAEGLVSGQSDPRERLAGLLLALITVLVYLPAGFHGFVDFDDREYVASNAVVQNGLTWAGFKWAFGLHASNWHPLTWLSHELDCQLFGLNAGAHHLVNVLFHAANAVLLFQLWLRLTKAFWPSALVAALFAWHPLHVESVAWVAERKDVLCAFFGLLTLLFYTRYAQESGARSQKPGVGGSPGRSSFLILHSSFSYCLALFCFGLGLLAKPMLVTLPFVLLLLDYWPLSRMSPFQPCRAWQLAREKWPFFLLTVLSCAATFLAQDQDAVISLQQLPMSLRLENAVVAVAAYLGNALWPVNLCVFYPLPRRYPVGELLCAATVLAGISVLAWRWRWKHRWLLAGWLWFLGMLVPVIGLMQVGAASRADRYTYLPVVGLFVAAAFGLAEARARWNISIKPLVLGAILILGGCVAATEQQLSYWRDTETLFTRAIAVTQNNCAAHMFLGIYYRNQGRTDEARRQFQEAMNASSSVMMPVAGRGTHPQAEQELVLGRLAEGQRHLDQAIGHYRAALRLDPNLVEAHNNLGNVLDETGQADQALTEYQAAARLQPEAPLVHENLGTQLAKTGRFEEAMREYQAAVRLAPEDPQPVYLMGKAWLRRGKSAEAVAAFQKALQLNPNDCPSLVWLARVLAADETPAIRNGSEAVTLAERANQLTGGAQPSVLGTLAMAYAETGRFEEARKTAQTALGLAGGGGSDQETLAGLQEQLRLYENRQPFREMFTNLP